MKPSTWMYTNVDFENVPTKQKVIARNYLAKSIRTEDGQVFHNPLVVGFCCSNEERAKRERFAELTRIAPWLRLSSAP